MAAAYLYDAVRAPFGRSNGETYGIGRDDLAERLGITFQDVETSCRSA